VYQGGYCQYAIGEDTEVQDMSPKLLVTGGFVKTAMLEEEWYEDVDDPDALIRQVKNGGIKADLLSFWQRFPHTKPRFSYRMEWDSIAVLRIESYRQWFEKQIDTNARRGIKKAISKGVEVRMCEFNDDFVRGMTTIFNETPVRQGRRFWHYGKNFETVKKEFARYLFREELIGAYYKGELVGFVMLCKAGPYALPGQILSMVKHRDKSINNALLARAIQLCEERHIPYLVYYLWGRGSLSEFKRRNGFQETKVPRYYVPLTIKGSLALRCNLHRGVEGIFPARLIDAMKDVRSKLSYLWYGSRAAA